MSPHSGRVPPRPPLKGIEENGGSDILTSIIPKRGQSVGHLYSVGLTLRVYPEFFHKDLYFETPFFWEPYIFKVREPLRVPVSDTQFIFWVV